MATKRMRALQKMLLLNKPAQEEVIKDVLEITKAHFPEDYLEFIRESNGLGENGAPGTAGRVESD